MNEYAEVLMAKVQAGEAALQGLKDNYTDYPPAKEFLWNRLDAPWFKQQDEIKAAYAQGVESAAKVAENEPEPDGPMPEAMHLERLEDCVRGAVRATAKSIADAIRALITPEEK